VNTDRARFIRQARGQGRLLPRLGTKAVVGRSGPSESRLEKPLTIAIERTPYAPPPRRK